MTLRVTGTKKNPTAHSEGLWSSGLGNSDMGSLSSNNRSDDCPIAKFAISLFPVTHHSAIVFGLFAAWIMTATSSFSYNISWLDTIVGLPPPATQSKHCCLFMVLTVVTNSKSSVMDAPQPARVLICNTFLKCLEKLCHCRHLPSSAWSYVETIRQATTTV